MSHLQTNYKLVLKDSALDHFASDIYIVDHHVYVTIRLS